MNRRPQHKKSTWNNIPAYFANVFKEMIESNPQACKSDEIPQGIGQFGLDTTNPIPIHGIPDNEAYLSRLRLDNGNKITWRRGGSVMVDNIELSIDCYEIFDAKRNTVTILYLSPYHLKTSNKAPFGFKLI